MRMWSFCMHIYTAGISVLVVPSQRTFVVCTDRITCSPAPAGEILSLVCVCVCVYVCVCVWGG